jgi:hypothetical protein
MSKTKRGLALQWYAGCSTDREREARYALLTGSSPAFDVLLALLEKEKLDLLTVRDSDYSDSAWACKQAHRNGRLDELDRLVGLLRSVTIDHNG